VVVGIIALVAGVAALIAFSYTFSWNWTGFPAKNLWDWLQLLFVPTLLAIGGFWFNRIQKDREQEGSDKRANTERAIAQDNQREVALQAYIDKMADLLEKHLRESKPEEEVRKIANIRTLTILPRLDGRRKGFVVQFLRESGLISINKDVDREKADELSIISLFGADLSGADLNGPYRLNDVNLAGAILNDAHLEKKDLSGAHLYYAELNGAHLEKADLTEAFLVYAKLKGVRLKRARLQSATLTAADLSGAFLMFANMGSTILNDTDLTGADLSGASFLSAKMTGVNLTDAKLPGAKLQQIKFYRGPIGGSVGSSANLTRADLTGANLSGADLMRAHLTGAHLSGANLSAARLIEADLSSADLSGANLKEADLRGLSLIEPI